MATAVQIPLTQYMHTSYRSDCEYVDGTLLERNVGKWEHARLQAILTGWFHSQEKQWGVMAATGQRVQVSATRVRIADIVLARRGQQPDVLVDPPLLAVEILSPDDRYPEMQARAQDYLKMGVGAVWIIEPKTRTGRYLLDDVWTTARYLNVPDSPVQVDVEALFCELDSMVSLA